MWRICRNEKIILPLNKKALKVDGSSRDRIVLRDQTDYFKRKKGHYKRKLGKSFTIMLKAMYLNIQMQAT